MQERLLALLLIAVVPLCILGGLLAWQNYLVLAAMPARRVELVHQAAAARYQAIIDDAARALEGLSREAALREGSTDGCDELLRRAYGVQREEFGALAVVLRKGGVRCAASEPGTALNQDTFDAFAGGMQNPGAGPFDISLIEKGPLADFPTLLLRTRLPGSSQTAANGSLLVATLRVDWLIQPRHAVLPDVASSIWFIDAANTVMPIGHVSERAFPSSEDLQRLLARGAPTVLTAPDGEQFAYQASILLSGLKLLVATSADADVAAAQRNLGVRFAELGAFLLAGLAAVTLGANLTVVEPLKRLSGSVQRWRAGGTFDPTPPDRAPVEIRDLALSFSQAAGSLAEREKQLRLATTQQDLLMQEIHHRVKNNLQIIASLLNLQASRIRQPEARAEFQSARDRIRALATLHRHLYAHNELHTINMRSFLNELCGQLVAAIGDRPGENATERINLQIDAPELQISSDQAVPIALIVTEAVSNAAKYAFPGGRTGNIWVRLTTERRNTTRDGSSEDEAAGATGETDVAEHERAILVIRDDGVGIPAGRGETEMGVRDGLGIQLIRGFARQLGAKLTVTEDGGTCYEIDIPLRRARSSETPPPDIAAEPQEPVDRPL